MQTLAPAAQATSAPQLSFGTAKPSLFTEARWSLAFFGILFYLVFEYARLPMMFPVLVGSHMGKIVVAVTALGLMLSPRLQSRLQIRGMDLAVLAFVAVSLLSTILARDQELAWSAFADMARWGVIYFLVSRIVTSRWRLQMFMLLFILLNLKLAQFQIRSYFFQLAGGSSEEYLARGVGAGSVGFFANSTDFGIAMCVAWPLAATLFFAESRKVLKILYLASFVVTCAALLLSGSRGALVGAAATALVVWLRDPKKLLGPFMALALVLGVVYLLPDANKDRIRSAVEWKQDKNVVTRLVLWETGLKMFMDNPVLGVGPGNYRPAYLQYDRTKDDPQRVLAPHSIYIQALSELGFLGTVVLLMLCFKALLLNARIGRRAFVPGAKKQPYVYYLALGLNLALVGYLVSGAFLTVLYYPHFWFLLGLSASLSVACSQEAGQAADEKLAAKLPALSAPVNVAGAPPVVSSSVVRHYTAYERLFPERILETNAPAARR